MVRLALSTVLTLLLAASCGFTGDASDRPGDWLLVNNMAEPGHLDPALVTSVEDQRINLALFEGLVGYHPETLAPVPGVALDWSIDRGGRRYRFRLRPCRWSDGTPLTAEDFVYAWRRVLTRPGGDGGAVARPIAAPYADLLYSIVGARAFHEGRTSDFETVALRARAGDLLEVELERPVPWFLELLAFPTFSPVPRHVVEAEGPGWTRAGTLVSNGPFVLAARRLGDSLEVRRNPVYWDRERVGLDGIVYYSTDQIDTALDQYLAGETDWVRGFNPKKARAWRADPELSRALRAPPYLATYFYRLNVRRPPLDDARVRRALGLAIDRRAIVRHVTGLGEEPAWGLVPPVMARFLPWRPLDEEEGSGHDPERARGLLAEAGFPGGRGFPPLVIAYNTDIKNKAVAEVVQQSWTRELGIPVVLENREKRVHLALERAGDYMVSRGSWVGDYNDPTTFLDFMLSTRANNRTGWGSEEFDRLVAESFEQDDEASRLDLLRRAERLLVADEAPLLPIFHFRTPFVLRPGAFEGIHPNPRDLHPPKWIRPAGEGRR